MKFNQNAFGWGVGVVCALWMFLMALFAMSGTWGAAIIGIYSAAFAGYAATWGGAIIGLIWGFILGYISGYIFAWVYNYVIGRK